MSFKIGFTAENNEDSLQEEAYTASQQTEAPRKSVVQVYFEGRNTTLTYYNDRFDLHCGDTVFVDGKLEGIRGRIIKVNYNFKIKLSDYKRVIAVADTTVSGQFFNAGSQFLTFDRNAIPGSKVITWFRAPVKEEDEFVSSSDDTSFLLEKPESMDISPVIAERGVDYFIMGKVRYISIDGTKGYAIVEGGDGYEVEFDYRNGEISRLVCSCFCSYNCKHEFAAMLQLKETLEFIDKHYRDEYERTGYFAAINRMTLLRFAFDGKETGSFML